MILNDVTQTPIERLTRKLVEFDQGHLLAFWNELNESQKEALIDQIDETDFGAISELYQGGVDQDDWHSIAKRATSPSAIRDAERNDPRTRDRVNAAAESVLRNARVGVILVAGGQGSRLGFEQPKGMFPIGPISGRTLFQVFFDQVLALRDRYRSTIPIYVMTSPATHDATTSYFQENDFCGLPETDVRLFCQGTMPAVDASTGRILLEEKWQVATSPDGHGGMLSALCRAKCLDDIVSRGIEQLFYLQVDNPLAPICDHWMLGNHILRESEMTTLVVPKRTPDEKVGNVVSVDGRMLVIEYSDLQITEANRCSADGQLEFWAGSTAIHIFDTSFLVQASHQADSLPFHRALKAVPFLNESGRRAHPVSSNAIKFERFIFDLMPAARNALVVEAAADQVFAPLKNASGSPTDTPESARAGMVRQSRRLLEAAGVNVDNGVEVEVNPRFAWDATQAAAKIQTKHISSTTYFGP